MKITITYDNATWDPNLISDSGFSCYVELGERKILFDKGGNGRILPHNLRSLNIAPGIFSDVFISHPDFDHIGGLSDILNANHSAVVHVPVSFRGIRYDNAVHYYSEPAVNYDGIYTTGELGKQEQSLALASPRV